GIMTSDPRMVSSARRILQMSFAEAAELAYFGAKVLHPDTIYPAVTQDIPVWVYNSRNPANSGTEITREAIFDPNIIKAIACKRSVTMITIHSTRMLGASGFLKGVFDIFARHDVSVDLISTSEVSVSLTVDVTPGDPRIDLIRGELSAFSKVTIE